MVLSLERAVLALCSVGLLAAGCLSDPKPWTPDGAADAEQDGTRRGDGLGDQRAADLTDTVEPGDTGAGDGGPGDGRTGDGGPGDQGNGGDAEAEGVVGTDSGDTGPDACSPSCDLKECGDNGCGGSCGGCPDEHECHDFVCYPDSAKCEDEDESAWDGCSGGFVSDLLVNSSYTKLHQLNPDIALGGGENIMVVWESCPNIVDRDNFTVAGQDQVGCGVFGQLFSREGVTLGAEFQVNTDYNWRQEDAAIAGFNDGFGVVWLTWAHGGVWDVSLAMYYTDGAVRGQETTVDAVDIENDSDPAVAISDSAQGIAVAWRSWIGGEPPGYGIRYALMQADPLDSESFDPVGEMAWTIEPTPGDETQPVAVEAITNQGFAVVWGSNRAEPAVPHTEEFDVLGVIRAFDGSAPPFGAESLVVNQTTEGSQGPAAIRVIPDEHAYVAAYLGYLPDGMHVLARRIEPESGAHSVEKVVSGPLGDHPGQETLMDVAVLNTGHIVVVWTQVDTAVDAESGVFGRIISPDLKELYEPFHINSFTAGNQSRPAVLASPSGGFFVTWDSCPILGTPEEPDNNAPGGQDGSGCGVFAKRFNGAGQPAPFVSQN